MHLSFNELAVITAGLFSLIAAVWLFAPTRFLMAWGVKASAETSLMGKRLAALYAGVALMFFMARNAPPSSLLAALISGLICTCLILALLGSYERFKGRASNGIFIAVFIELALALLWISVVAKTSS